MSGAFASKPAARRRPWALLIGLTIALKAGYDFGVAHEEWKRFDVLRKEPGVELWNLFVHSELRKAIDSPSVRARLGDEVAEDDSAPMKESAEFRVLPFRRWSIVQVDGTRSIRVPIKGTDRAGALVVEADRPERSWRLKRVYLDDGEQLVDL